MSVCPVPFKAVNTNYTSPGSFTAGPPSAKYVTCEGGTSSVVTGPGTIVTELICCPSPGPAGPQGAVGPAGVDGCSIIYDGPWSTGVEYFSQGGSPCKTSIITHNFVTYITTVTHTSDASTEPGIGASWDSVWDLLVSSGTGNMKWKGDWVDGFTYYINDVVRNAFTGNAYIAVTDHVSVGALDEPGFGSAWEDEWMWITDSAINGMPPEQKSFIEQLKNDVFDWMKNATVGDWLQALAIGAGIVYAGVAIYDHFFDNGDGDGQADSRYTGSDGYNGSFTAPSLQAVVSSLMLFAGYSGADFDVTLLPPKPIHFVINSAIPVRTALYQLSLAYQFDIVPSGGQIRFIPKDQAVVRTLTADDLGHTAEDGSIAGTMTYAATRLQGIDLPRSVALNYYSNNIDYNVFTQQSTMETYPEGQDIVLDVPFVMSDAEAKRIAESTLVNAHIERQEYIFTTDYTNIDLEPGDVILLPLDVGGTVRVRITALQETEDGILQFTAVGADINDATYVASGVIPSPPPVPTNVPTVIGYSATLFIEVPPINGNEVQPRLLGITHGYNRAGWPGASVYTSVDGGANYSLITNTLKQPTWGLAATAMSNPPNGLYQVWDTTTTISVQLKQGTLISKSDIAVQNGENWCMIGEEVVGFANASLTAPNTYTLSRLLRGRAGSEGKVGSHQTNELFVVLDNQLTEFPYPQGDVGKIVKFKTVTIGSDISSIAAVDVQPYALNMRPWRVALPKAVKTGNNWDLSWIERPRYNNQMRDYTELNHDPDWAGFAIAILDNMDVVKRSTIVTSNTFQYTEAMQITDFGSVQGTIKASIIQMSQTNGGGYPYVITA